MQQDLGEYIIFQAEPVPSVKLLEEIALALKEGRSINVYAFEDPKLQTDLQFYADFFMEKDHKLVICDDVSLEDNPFLMQFFKKYSHHFNTSTFYLSQNGCEQGKYSSSIAKNAHYTTIMRSGRDSNTVQAIGRQIGDCKNLQTAYKLATREPYSYLLIDTHPRSLSDLKFRSCIFGDELCIVFVPREVINFHHGL